MSHPSGTPPLDRFTDQDVAFYLLVYQDFNRAAWCLSQLRKHYPTSPVVIQSDGDADPRYATLTADQTTVLHGERLFRRECGGQLAARAVASLQSLASRHVIRIDTDTETRRRLSHLPDAHYYGSRHARPENWIQGGCIGMSLQAVRQLATSRIFESPAAADFHNWAPGNADVQARVELHGLVSFDWLLAWGMTMCDIPAVDFPEICSRWQQPIPETVDCAFAHPCKHIPISRAI